MFPLAHAWSFKRLVPAATPAHGLGCIWPDMLFGSPLSHYQSHGSGTLLVDELRNFGAHELSRGCKASVIGQDLVAC